MSPRTSPWLCSNGIPSLWPCRLTPEHLLTPRRQNLIAVNYAARPFGVGRHCTAVEAKKLCPTLITQHVATWREGEEKWAYHPDAAANMATHKVSLDPYRLESRRIIAVIKEHLPANLQKVEKASIDEVFLDLSAHVHSIMLERFPELAKAPPQADPSERLPMPPTCALDWAADALVDLDHEETETSDPDWDDVAILIGSEIVRGVRAAIREKLKYTSSAGIANNKMVSKLGSGYKKPNQQTVIRNRAIRHFMSGFKFTKIRNLGGKLGDQVAHVFNTDTVNDLLAVSVEQLKLRLGDDTGVWVYNIIRGLDSSEVNPRTQIKSMLSAKSFNPGINTLEQGVRWLRVFVADIYSRLVEEGVLENKRRPRTLNLHHRHGGQTRSRQGPIPQGKALDEGVLFDYAKSLLTQIARDGHVWPCANLSLSIGGFEDGITGNMGIGGFLVKGDNAQALKPSLGETSGAAATQPLAIKRRRADEGGIHRFFPRAHVSHGSGPQLGVDDVGLMASDYSLPDKPETGLGSDMGHHQDEPLVVSNVRQEFPSNGEQIAISDYVCPRCDARLETAQERQSHQDWHLAKELQEEEERVRQVFANPAATTALISRSTQRDAAASSKRSGKSKKMEPGQSKLKFS